MNKKQKRKTGRAAKRREAREGYEAYAKLKAERRAAKKARKEEQERKAAIILMSAKSEKDKFSEWAGGLRWALKRFIMDQAPKLMDERFYPALKMIDRAVWVRDLDEWNGKRKGKSPYSLFRSLVNHLLVKYTMPEFMYSVFFIEEPQTRDRGFKLFIHLGQGGSMYKAVKAGMLGTLPLTKKGCHIFLSSKAKHNFLSALRYTQVEIHGGSHRTAEAIMGTRQIGRGLVNANEDFWDHVIQWTCNQPMLAPAQIVPIYDWISGQRGNVEGFSMKGRTGTSVLRAVEEWHGQLAREKKIHGHKYEPAGFDPLYYEKKILLPGGGKHMQKHCITEVATSKELAAEGRAMRHCVYSYSYSIQRGSVSIWSYKVDGERMLTIEVVNKTRSIVQVRGRANRKATASEMAVVERWAHASGLTFGSRRWL